jgi:hypothetical protein
MHLCRRNNAIAFIRARHTHVPEKLPNNDGDLILFSVHM